jgi:hypothetical protein
LRWEFNFVWTKDKSFFLLVKRAVNCVCTLLFFARLNIFLCKISVIIHIHLCMCLHTQINRAMSSLLKLYVGEHNVCRCMNKSCCRQVQTPALGKEGSALFMISLSNHQKTCLELCVQGLWWISHLGPRFRSSLRYWHISHDMHIHNFWLPSCSSSEI